MPEELDPPRAATIVAYDDLDHIGRVRLDDGEELRFGRSACKELVPAVGMVVYLTVVDRHPLGGRKAVALRSQSVSEAAARDAAREAELASARDAAADAAARRERVRPSTTHDAIVARVVEASTLADHGDADVEKLYSLVDDLELVGRSPDHVVAILRGIASSDPLTHFGSPGPLVHYAETFYRQGYEDALRDVAASTPTSHFAWMLARLVNDPSFEPSWPLELLRRYASSSTVPEALRAHARKFVDELETRAAT